MSRRRFVATFANGHVAKRESDRRVYTHAYCFEYVRKADGARSIKIGFSTSAAQCEANQRGESAWLREKPDRYAVTLLPIVETVRS